jgi:hypothetical protein
MEFIEFIEFIVGVIPLEDVDTLSLILAVECMLSWGAIGDSEQPETAITMRLKVTREKILFIAMILV